MKPIGMIAFVLVDTLLAEALFAGKVRHGPFPNQQHVPEERQPASEWEQIANPVSATGMLAGETNNSPFASALHSSGEAAATLLSATAFRDRHPATVHADRPQRFDPPAALKNAGRSRSWSTSLRLRLPSWRAQPPRPTIRLSAARRLPSRP